MGECVGGGGSHPEGRIPACTAPPARYYELDAGKDGKLPRGVSQCAHHPQRALRAGHRQGREGLRGTYPSVHPTPQRDTASWTQARVGRPPRGVYHVHSTHSVHTHITTIKGGDGLYLKDVYICRSGTKCSASLFLVGGAGTLGKRSPFHIPCLFLILPPQNGILSNSQSSEIWVTFWVTYKN